MAGSIRAGGVGETTSRPFEAEMSLVRRSPLALAFGAPSTISIPVRADARGVSVGGRFVPRSQIRAGFVVAGERVPRVFLQTRRAAPIELEAGSAEEARSLLFALGLDVSQTVATFRIPSRVRAAPSFAMALFLGSTVLGLVLSAAAGPPFRSVGALLLVTALLVFTAAVTVPTALTIGADGLSIRWLWTHRFVGYDEIASLSRYDKGPQGSRRIGLELALHSGQTVQILVQMVAKDFDQRDIIEERIRQARDGFRRVDTAADAATLERGTRPIDEWVVALQAIGSGANATPRTAPVPRDRLLRIVEDPSLSAPVRAAAAVAVGAELDDDDRARLRVAAEATAEPRLRIAIGRAAAGARPRELQDALAEVERAESSALLRRGLAP